MKSITIIILVLALSTTVFGEDWQGYVLRYNYQGRDFYWVYDDMGEEI